jgi:isopenicillin N synthase-like dioxygenase
MRAQATATESIDRIPVVDLAPFRAGTRAGKQQVAKDIREAAEGLGFLYYKNHGVPADVVETAFAVGRRFFDLPLEAKLAVKVNKAHRGYIPFNNAVYSAELKPNLNESFLMGLDLPADDPDVLAGVPMHGPNQWPAALPELRPALEGYFDALGALGQITLRAFALALDLDEDYFVPRFTKPMPFIRLLHYPPQIGPRAENEFGAAAHTDYGFVTILAQDDVGGLQVKRRDGGWIEAPPVAGTFVVNIADMLMRWTNDRWVSTPHRVINASGRERYSLPFFFDPTYHTLVSCLDSCQGPDQAAKYPPITWGDYLTRRFDQTYAYRKEKQA